jgi:N-acetylglutamate synthase
MKICLMTVMDYEKVFLLWSRTEGMGLDDIDDSMDGIAKFLKRNPSSCFVAEERGEILGAILGGHDGRRGHIYHAAVDADYRGRGIGKALAKSVIEAFRREGITKASLVVFRSNEPGNSFWLRNGWEKRLDLNYFNLKTGAGYK